ncbi:MAG TPA: ATP-binding protein [Casimicrobiaceae bacterium]|nr:ATP-binding protein [Casimicrobiaceae bacterium]
MQGFWAALASLWRSVRQRGEARHRRDALLSRTLSRLIAAADPRDMAREIFDAVAGEMQLDGYFNYDVEGDGQTLRLASCAGVDDNAVGNVQRLPLGASISGKVAQSRAPIYVPDVQSSPIDGIDFVRAQGFRVYFSTPLVVADRLLGTLAFGSRRRDSFDDSERALIVEFGNYLAIAKERGASAEALRRSEQRLQLALDTAQLGTWWYDVPADELWGDKRTADIYGLPMDRTPVSFSGVIVPMIRAQDADQVGEAWARAIDATQRGRFETRYGIVRSVDGAARHIEALGHVVFEGHGEACRAVRAFGTVLDVTARVDAESKREGLLTSERHARRDAERAARLKDEFLATLSHELRSPLNAVLGWTQVLRLKYGRELGVGEGLAVVERNARAQAQIIDDLLDMSRITSGKVHMEVRPVDMGAVALAAIETTRPAADAKEIAIAFAREDGPLIVRGDASRLQQVMWNLLSNAVKFTPERGRIDIALKRDGDTIEVTVGDNGIGIDPQFLPHIFERFRQADGSSTRRFSGLGLGLAIVKQLVEMHGGNVRVTSQGRDRGTTFTIYLKALNQVVLAESSQAALPSVDVDVTSDQARTARNELAGARVLVVEDDPDAREFTVRLLREWGADVDAVASAGEALAELDREPPSLLVSDIGMPGEDGYVLMRRVRSMPAAKARRLPAIALTAYARAEDRLKALQAGFDMHVPKPVEPAELLAVCSTLLARADALRP